MAKKRIPRKKGQRRNSKKHSDLYTDENPKDTIKGLKFATVKDAEASVRKIKNSKRKHNHKTQAAIAMEQRAKVAGKKSAAAVYRKFIEQQKKKTKAKNETKLIRNYIRNILLTEGMYTPSLLKEKNIHIIFKVSPSQIWLQAQKRPATGDPNPRFGNVGQLSLRWQNDNYYGEGNCDSAWSVEDAGVVESVSGLGPLLYDLAMEFAGEDGIMSDRHITSLKARKVWYHYLGVRDDVEAFLLDYRDEPWITPNDPSDDCSQRQYDGSKSSNEIDELTYSNHFSTNKFRKKPLHTDTINALYDLGLLTFKFIGNGEAIHGDRIRSMGIEI